MTLQAIERLPKVNGRGRANSGVLPLFKLSQCIILTRYKVPCPLARHDTQPKTFLLNAWLLLSLL